MKDMEKCDLISGASETLVTVILNCRLYENRYFIKIAKVATRTLKIESCKRYHRFLEECLNLHGILSASFLVKNKRSCT